MGFKNCKTLLCLREREREKEWEKLREADAKGEGGNGKDIVKKEFTLLYSQITLPSQATMYKQVRQMYFIMFQAFRWDH